MKRLLRKILITLVVSLLSFNLALADTIWIDVRTVGEYNADHIEGDVNIPLAEVREQILALVSDKDTEISLYCRSGNRAGQAKNILEEMGFTNVSNAGGINAVLKIRQLAESSPAN